MLIKVVCLCYVQPPYLNLLILCKPESFFIKQHAIQIFDRWNPRVMVIHGVIKYLPSVRIFYPSTLSCCWNRLATGLLLWSFYVHVS